MTHEVTRERRNPCEDKGKTEENPAKVQEKRLQEDAPKKNRGEMQEGSGKKKKAKKAKDEVKEAVKEEKKSAPAASKVKVTIFIKLRAITDGC